MIEKFFQPMSEIGACWTRCDEAKRRIRRHVRNAKGSTCTKPYKTHLGSILFKSYHKYQYSCFPGLQLLHLQMMFANPAWIFAGWPWFYFLKGSVTQ